MHKKGKANLTLPLHSIINLNFRFYENHRRHDAHPKKQNSYIIGDWGSDVCHETAYYLFQFYEATATSFSIFLPNSIIYRPPKPSMQLNHR
jgi:hypothetical protein